MAVSLVTLTTVSWIATAVALLLTAGRLWIRRKITKEFAADDAIHILALLFLISQVSIVSVAAPMIYTTVRDPFSGQDFDIVLYARLNTAALLLSWSTLWAVKMAFLFLYRRIFRVSARFVLAWWTVLAFVVLSFWALFAGSITPCGKPSQLATESCLEPENVQRTTAFLYWSCILNVVSDLAIMGLPLFMLKGLQMRPGIKLAFSGVFSLAIITIIFDIVRVIESFVEEGVAGTVPLFTNLESAVAVVVSCLPSYVSLMRARTRSSADKHGGAPYQERPLAVTGSARQLMNTKESMNTKDSFCSNDKDFPLIAPEV